MASRVSAGCYYVDNTDARATDTGNGTLAFPWLTLPSNVAFTRIEIVGGRSDYTLLTRTWTGSGSRESRHRVPGGAGDL